jgi:LPXTG-site transpeptidase (sortase) family protein
MPNGGRRRLLLALAGVALAVAVAGAGLLLAGQLRPATGGPAARAPAAPDPPVARRDVQSPAPDPTAAPSPGWAWRPLPAARVPFVPVRLVIDRLQVEAPVVQKAVDRNNVMESPDGPNDVAWYRFTSRPGSGSNAVFSGHRDFPRVGPAVFWRLDQLVAGDVIRVVSAQQTEIDYRVTRRTSYRISGIPMQEILTQEPVEELTLITCSGSYSTPAGYDERLVIRAVHTA